MTGKGHLLFGTAIGTLAYSLCHVENTPENIGTALVVASVGALAPDLDEVNSTLSRKFTRIPKSVGIRMITAVTVLSLIAWVTNLSVVVLFALGAIACYFIRENTVRKVTQAVFGIALASVGAFYGWVFAIGFGLFVAIAPWTKHRTATHTIWAVLLCHFMSLDFERFVGIDGIAYVSTAAYVSHILADSLTKGRTKILWPLSEVKFGVGIFRVNSQGGVLVEQIICILMLAISIAVYISTYGIL